MPFLWRLADPGQYPLFESGPSTRRGIGSLGIVGRGVALPLWRWHQPIPMQKRGPLGAEWEALDEPGKQGSARGGRPSTRRRALIAAWAPHTWQTQAESCLLQNKKWVGCKSPLRTTHIFLDLLGQRAVGRTSHPLSSHGAQQESLRDACTTDGIWCNASGAYHGGISSGLEPVVARPG